MIVSFINLKRGHAAQTSGILAIALMMAMEDKKKVLMIHTGIKSRSMEVALLGKKAAETGIDELKRVFMQKNLSEAEIRSCCHVFLEDRLFLLTGTRAENEVMFEEIMQGLFPILLHELQKYFDYIFIDIENNNGDMAKGLINISQQLVISTSQNPEEMREADRIKTVFGKARVFWLLGRYDKKSRFDYGYVRRNFMGGIGKRLGTIAYCSGFMDAMFKGKLIDFFRINSDVTAGDINYEFIKSVRETKNKFLMILEDGEYGERKRN